MVKPLTRSASIWEMPVSMPSRVIQGYFPGGHPRLPTAPPEMQSAPAPRSPGPPPTRFGGRAQAAKSLAAPRPPGPPVADFAARGRAPIAQRHQGRAAFPIDPARLGLANGGGRPLPDWLRTPMEAALRADFSRVRIHVGPQAERIGAHAFTTGPEIYFAPGQFRPETAAGRRLLGHELAHVVQQREGRVRGSPGISAWIVRDQALEMEAERWSVWAELRFRFASVEARTGSGSRSSASRRTGAAPIQRYEVVDWDGDKSQLLAQELDSAGVRGEDDFLSSEHLARVAAASGKTQLRVSDDGQMAIEHSDLSQRQAKCFFATKSVIDAGNEALDAGKGMVRLATTGQTIQVPYKSGQVKLLQVVPRAVDAIWPGPDGSESSEARQQRIAAIQFSQNCNDIAQQISGLVQLRDSRLNVESVLSLTGMERERFYADLRKAEDANKGVRENLVQQRVSSNAAVIEARQWVERLEPRLRNLQATLRSTRASSSAYWQGLASYMVGWGDTYTQEISRLETLIEQLRRFLQHYRDIESNEENKTRSEVALDNTVKKIQQSPVWNLAERYVKLINDQPSLKERNLNEFARAGVGDVYQISHLATSDNLLREDLALHDFARGRSVPPTNWSWHFATVVAVSGPDRITLENYARGDMRQSGPDPRWYFQMYGSQRGQSFHEETARSGTYANPVTVVHRRG
jgi:hypothetical protein